MLEIGAGLGSTPMLRDYCHACDRPFWSYDSSFEWAAKAGAIYDKNYVQIEQIAADPEIVPWGVVFVDHAPEEDRIRMANLFRGKARFVLIHDWSSADTNAHGSIEEWATCKVDQRFFPTTIILSMGDIPF